MGLQAKKKKYIYIYMRVEQKVHERKGFPLRKTLGM